MRAFHTLRYKKPMADFELLTMVLSALEWRKHNGEITLVTDSKGWVFIQQHNLQTAWNDIDLSLDEWEKMHINESVFWAGAKIFALYKQTAPCMMIDLDFIVWQTLHFDAIKSGLAVIHREDVNNEIYPEADFFKLKQGYTLPKNLDWTEKACNTAFAYFGKEDFKLEYCTEAMKFMQNANVTEDYLHYMVFAEQRLLAMCAKKEGIEIKNFSDLGSLLGSEQNYFTHLWGYKETLRKNNDEAEEYCRKCVQRLKIDFPKWVYRYKNG